MPKQQQFISRKVHILEVQEQQSQKTGSPYWRVKVGRIDTDWEENTWHTTFEGHAAANLTEAIDTNAFVLFKKNKNPNYSDNIVGMGDLEETNSPDTWDDVQSVNDKPKPAPTPSPTSNRNASIERQTALYAASKLAVALVGAGVEMSSQDVLAVATTYDEWIKEVYK